MSRTDQRNLILAILVFLFVNFSIAFAIGHRWWRSCQEALLWPVTTGTVKSLQYKGDQDDIKIIYGYVVEGRSYEGRQIRIGFRGDVRDLLESQKMSSAVQVHYYPADPSTSVLLPAPSPATVAMKTVGLAGMILSALSAVAIWRFFARPDHRRSVTTA